VRRAGKHVDHLAERDVDKAGIADHIQVLLHEERPCDSTGPEVNVRACFVRDRELDHHVGYLHVSTRFEDAKHFAIHRFFVRAEVDDAIADDDVHGSVGDR